MSHTPLDQLVALREMCRTGDAREIRVAAGLSLPEVATAVGVAPSTISRWERAERVARGKGALRYAGVLGDLLEAIAQ